MYCSKCGTRLPEGAKFCHSCGAAVPTQIPQQSAPQPTYPPVKPRPKWLIPVAVGGSLLAVFIVLGLAAWMIGSLISGGEKGGAPASLEFVEPGTEEGEGSSFSESSAPSQGTAGIAKPEETEASSSESAVSSQSADKADLNQIVDEILTKVEGTPGFIEPDSYYEPLCSLTDADGNGVYEFLVFYKVKEKNEFKALYDVYRIEDGEYNSLRTGFDLYDEVGGNGGTVGLVVDKAARVYLKLETRSPQGDRFNDTLTYTPLNREQSAFDDDTVYLECHGTYGEEDNGRYMIGDTAVDKAAYEARQTEFMSLWTDLDLNKGPGNGGNNMSFEQIRFLDMNEYGSAAVG